MIILMLRMIRMIILMLRMIIQMGQDDGAWFMAKGSWPRGASRALEPGGAPGPDTAGPGAPPGPRAGPAPLGHEQ